MSLDVLGCTHDTMATTTGRDGVTLSQSLEKSPQFGLRAATRPHEVGIASNRGSERRGEYVLKSCTHRLSSQGSWECPKSVLITAYGKLNDRD
jgi:hypothetical protein